MSTPPIEYDVFISHASEDKASFVRDLASLLVRLGLRVWYDEDRLQIGDSLSRTIDNGLAHSHFGVLVMSEHFLKKPWPEYELRGLLAREIGGQKVILPIWLDVSREQVLAYSPSLADKYALSFPGNPIERIAFHVFRVARPDLAESLSRYLVWRRSYSDAKISVVHRSELKAGPIRHTALPPNFLVRIRLIQSVLGDVAPMSIDEVVDNFKRDVDPGQEIAIWERIAVAFHTLTSSGGRPLEDKRNILGELLRLSMIPSKDLESLGSSGDESFQAILEAYIDASLAP